MGNDPLRRRSCVEAWKSGLNDRNRYGTEVDQNGIVNKRWILKSILRSSVSFRDRTCDRVDYIGATILSSLLANLRFRERMLVLLAVTTVCEEARYSH
jgi:hypothetical protein